MRLDAYLAALGHFSSRTEAKSFILDQRVTVNGKIITKPSYDASEDDLIEVDKSGKRFVSRGGLKLEAALDLFAINCEGRMALDVGASSGGFTDCLLKRGASRVIALDAGSGQLVDSIRYDERVVVMENYNARYMRCDDLEYKADLCVMDVSFISATLIFPSLHSCLQGGADYVCLIKPQFEVGRSGLSKGGIVKDEGKRLAARDKVIDSAVASGFTFLSVIESPIRGGDGNVEFLAHFRA